MEIHTDSWEETDRRIEVKKQQVAEKRAEEVDRWQGEIDTLMGRASHPEHDVEYIDLDTGKPVPASTDTAIAMPLYFSKSDQDEIEALLARRNQLVEDIGKLVDTLAESPDQAAYASHRADELKGELGAMVRRLYTLMTANPLITEDWLAENTAAWRPRDLATLITRFEQRNVEVVEQIRKFRSQRNRHRVGRVPDVARKNVG
jgi:hypothetical protein